MTPEKIRAYPKHQNKSDDAPRHFHVVAPMPAAEWKLLPIIVAVYATT